ncbi:MAG: hypothetical protein P8049_00630, partial [Gemmatimonadota bacterium]
MLRTSVDAGDLVVTQPDGDVYDPVFYFQNNQTNSNTLFDQSLAVRDPVCGFIATRDAFVRLCCGPTS